MKRHTLLFCLLVFISTNIFTTTKAQVDINDSLALVDLYNSTNGPNWTKHTYWLTNAPVSDWYGITVEAGRVTDIFLFNDNLSGTLPSSIGNLANLQELGLSRNQLSGAIPASIGNLANLEELYLAENQLTDNIPSSIGNLKEVRLIFLFYNQLSGSIPASIGNLVKLKDLRLESNQLSGSIPSSFGNLKAVQNLTLNDNQLNGAIPDSIGNLVNLYTLYLFNNQLSGVIPASIGNATHLIDLELNNNQLSGFIPTSFSNLTNLLALRLENNLLTGSIPSSIGNLSNLQSLFLSNNRLSGNIPSSFKKLKSLNYIDVSHNLLSESNNINGYPFLKKHLDLVQTNDNHFTFNGVEALAQTFPYAIYSPQDTLLPIHQHGNILAVNAGGTLSNNTYKWFGVGNADSTVIKGDSAFTPAQSGKYYVAVTNKIAAGLTLNSDTVEYTMPILAQSKVMNNAKHTAYVFTAYPSPVRDVLHVEVNGSKTIILTNATGKVLLTKTINNKGEISVSILANGTYYLQNKTTGETRKIVVIH